jgi:hypothetical protein
LCSKRGYFSGEQHEKMLQHWKMLFNYNSVIWHSLEVTKENQSSFSYDS